MQKGARKNYMMFFGSAAIAGTIAVFIFFIIFAAPQAYAYAIGGTSSAGISGYNFDNSLQNLISPFTNFMSNLAGGGNQSINVNGTNVALPKVNVNISTSATSASIQNLLSQWVSEFDNWFYSVTGVQLSGIMVALLNLLLWVLGLAQQVVNWLVGLFH